MIRLIPLGLCILLAVGCSTPNTPTTTQVCIEVTSFYTDRGIVKTPVLVNLPVAANAVILPADRCKGLH